MTETGPADSRALAGVRILDLTRLIPGPFATLVLRDLGACVDKIEDAGAGDYLRYVQPQVDGTAVAFHALNRGKRSAILDLKHPDGPATFMRLAGAYDVVFEQFRPGVMDRLGIGHAALRAAHPKLIVCALTGYGQTGPLAQKAGHDLNYLARAGILGLQGPLGGPPQVPAVQLADVSGGMWCAIAILAALRRRDQTGEGDVLDIAMSEGVLGFASLAVTAALNGAPPAAGDDVLSGGIAPYQTYLSGDDVPVTLASLEPKFWQRFAAAVGLDADLTALLPGPHQAALKSRLTEVFSARTAAEWDAFSTEHDCCLEVVVAPDAMDADAQLEARQMFFTAADGVRAFRTPVSDKSEAPPPAPKAGEHTRAVLAEAGFTGEEIDALAASGVIRLG